MSVTTVIFTSDQHISYCQLCVCSICLTPVTRVTKGLTVALYFLPPRHDLTLWDGILFVNHNNWVVWGNEMEDRDLTEWESLKTLPPCLCDLLVLSVILSHTVQQTATTTLHLGSKCLEFLRYWVVSVTLNCMWTVQDEVPTYSLEKKPCKNLVATNWYFHERHITL